METLNDLKIMTWNIHQQGRKGKEMPKWLIKYLAAEEFTPDVIMLTEFNCKADNINEFYEKLDHMGYKHFVTDYSDDCQTANDTLIAVRAPIKAVGHFYTPAYKPDKNCDHIPENLTVDIKLGGQAVRLTAVRIKTLGKDAKAYKKRKIQLDTLTSWLQADDKLPMILAGDFNNAMAHGSLTKSFEDVESEYYKNGKKLLQYPYNLHILQDELKKKGLTRADNAEPTLGNYISDDHIFVRGFTAKSSSCNDDFRREDSFIYSYNDIYPGFPDHKILRAELTLDEKNGG